MLMFSRLAILFALITSPMVLAADTTESGYRGDHWLIDGTGGRWPLGVQYTTDGASNPVPIMGATGGTVTANQGTAGASAWPISAASLPLPSGASTSAKQPALGTAGTPSADVITVQGSTSMTPLTISAASLPAASGRASVGIVRNVYSTTPVTTAAYVELVASTSDVVNAIFIFDSSGETLVLATGAAASEVDNLYIVPGGNGLVPLAVPAGTRVSIKAVSANATAGEISMTFFK